MAIIRALEEWQHYIQGSPHTTTVLSDHKNLTYYWDARKLNRRQARWSLYLSEFDIKLVHMAGTKMIQSDNLSRRPDYILDNNTDNEHCKTRTGVINNSKHTCRKVKITT